MYISELLKDIRTVPAEANRTVTKLTLDSRYVAPGTVFFAVKGVQFDGREYIQDAITKGAAAIICDTENPNEPISFTNNTPIIPVTNLRKKTSSIAARFYDFPARGLRMVGVTGTNGKTSCTHFIAQTLQSLHQSCGIIGTLGAGFYGELNETGLTTPDPITLQEILQQFVDKKAQAVAMEVSSHSIDQARISGIDFELGIFTNLTQDHLDYHGTMDAYAAVKRRFLADAKPKHIIINIDDEYGKKWAEELQGQQSVYTYSTQIGVSDNSATHIYADKITMGLHGISAMVHTPWGMGELNLPIIGLFNLSNVLAVLPALCLLGISFKEAIISLSQIYPVPGRMQKVNSEGKPLIIVDYAHTPDALDKVLESLRQHAGKKLTCVFGCGGDRDPGKRPLMAKIAEKWADNVIVTNDNPRHESPETIAKQIFAGFCYPDRAHIELDRTKAIQKSIQWSKEDDCILIAGKGAERYQQIGDQKYPFDDVEVVKKILSA